MSTLIDLRGLWADVGDLQEAHARRLASADLARYKGDIEGFVRGVLRVERLTPAQLEHFQAVQEDLRVAAYGANGCGKTFDDAAIALYLVYVEGSLVIVTSAREGQLRDQFMRDVRVLFQSAPDLDGELHTLALRRPGDAHSGIICVAAGETSRLRGFHAPRVAFIVEEAQGCPDWVFDVAEMVAVGEHDRVLVTGNCDLGQQGPFWRRCQTWRAIRFNSDQHPNVVEGRTVIPGGPTRESRAQRVADYGEDSPFFIASWLGLFPASGDYALFNRETIWAAFERWRALRGTRHEGLLHLALDPARKGPDSSVLAVRYGDVLEELIVWNKARTTESADRVVLEMKRLGVRLTHGVTVDEPGVGGGVVDALHRMGVCVREYNGGSTPSTPKAQKKFRNRRAETYWALRARLERGAIALPPDDKLADELLAMDWTEGPDGRVQIGSKDELRARIGRSPDRADAVAMVFGSREPVRWWVGAVEWGAGRWREPGRPEAG